jgi:hypothetical protein
VDNDGAQPASPEKTNCWDTFTFNTSTCTVGNDGAQTCSKRSELLGYFTQQFPVLGQMDHLQPEKRTVGILFTFLVLGIMMD